MITKCSQCSIKVFMDCLFENDFRGLDGGGKDELDVIHTEYVDLSGIGETREYELMISIHNTEERLTFITTQLEIQQRFFKNFDIPFVNAFDDFRKYGHRLTWDDNNPEAFLKQLDMIEIREKKFVAEYDKHVKELKTLKSDGVKIDGNGRRDFIRQMNNLRRFGYQVDKDKTDIEELALMIRDHSNIMREKAAKASKDNGY